MLSDWKVKIKGTSNSAAQTISRSEKEPVFESKFESLSSVSVKKIFNDDLPEIKRFVEKSNPMSFTKTLYSKPSPPDMQFEERSFQTQITVSADKIYEWNIDGLSE